MDIAHLPLALDAAIKSSVVLAGTFGAAWLLRRASAAARHLAWTLGLAGTLLVPALSLGLPRWEVPLVRVTASESMPESTPARAPAIVHRPHATATTAAHNGTAGTPAPSGASLAPQPASREARFGIDLDLLPWTTLLLIVWAAGAAVVLGRVALGLAAVQWMSRRMAVVTDAPWSAQARALAASLGLTRVRFLRSSTASMPMAWGILRPSILMPADADAWPADRLRLVLLHELAHVKRRDCATHVFAQIACAVYWFNPLAWMAARHLRSERERACDDLVLSAGTRGSEYASELLEVARVMRAGRFPAVLAGATLAMAHRSQLEGRLIAILDPTPRAVPPPGGRGNSVLLAAARAHRVAAAMGRRTGDAAGGRDEIDPRASAGAGACAGASASDATRNREGCLDGTGAHGRPHADGGNGRGRDRQQRVDVRCEQRRRSRG